MKVAEFKNLSTQELQEKLQSAQDSYAQTLLNHAVSPLANSASIKGMRRDIARMKTVLRQRENNN